MPGIGSHAQLLRDEAPVRELTGVKRESVRDRLRVRVFPSVQQLPKSLQQVPSNPLSPAEHARRALYRSQRPEDSKQDSASCISVRPAP